VIGRTMTIARSLDHEVSITRSHGGLSQFERADEV
jgi:hypothetical protein